MSTSIENILLLCTSRCNLKCKMCKYGDKDGIDLPLMVVQRLISEFAEAGIKTVYLSGGEPLLRKDFGKVLALLLEADLKVHLSTNGTLINQNRVQELRGIQDISVSLDGPKQVHDQIRGINGTFEKVIRGIEILRDQLPEAKICISITLLPENIDLLDDLISFAFALGIHAVGIQPLVPSFFSTRNIMQLRQDQKTIKKMAKSFHTLAEMDQSQLDNTEYFYHLSEKFIMNGFQSCVPCKAGLDIITVFADGRIGPCWALPTNINIKNLSYCKAVSQREFLQAVGKVTKGECPQCLFYCFFNPES